LRKYLRLLAYWTIKNMSCIKQAEEDAKAGKVRAYDEFLVELKESGEI
jgi:hypothetical protein